MTSDDSLDEIKRSAQALSKRHEWRRILDRVDDSIIVVDMSGRIVMANADAISLFEYPEESMLGHLVEEFIPERYRVDHSTKHRPRYVNDPRRRSMGERGGLDLAVQTREGKEVPVFIDLSDKMIEPEGTFVVVTIRRKER